MSFGAQIFIKGTTFDVVNSMTPSYLIDFFHPTGSGNKTYELPEGKSIRIARIADPFHSYYSLTTSVNGNTISWNTNSGGTIPIYVYAE